MSINATQVRSDNPVFPNKFAVVMTRAIRRIRQYHYSNGLVMDNTLERFQMADPQLIRDVVYYRIFREETFGVGDAHAMSLIERVRYCCRLGLITTRLPPDGSAAVFLGVDPGASGAFALVDENGKPVDHIRLNETQHDIEAWLRGYTLQIIYCSIERVGAMPKQGVSSTFKFGTSFGFVQGLIVARALPHDFVIPSLWQGSMKCRTKGDKNVSKAAAQRLFPEVKMTHGVADAYLLAEYTRRMYHERAGRG